MTQAADDVLNERKRQVEAEGWTAEHDDQHVWGQMAAAGAAYALSATLPDKARKSWRATFWPWDAAWWKPKDRRRDLVRAAALIIAEIERLDRGGEVK